MTKKLIFEIILHSRHKNEYSIYSNYFDKRKKKEYYNYVITNVLFLELYKESSTKL